MTDSGRTPWPETTIFWGAGATAALGMPVTADQGRALAVLGGAGSQTDDRPLHRRLEGAKVFDGIDDRVADLLDALGDDVRSYPAELSEGHGVNS